MLKFDWFIALDMFFLVKFVKGTWTLAAKRHVATCLEAPLIETPSLYLFLFVGGKKCPGTQSVVQVVYLLQSRYKSQALWLNVERRFEGAAQQISLCLHHDSEALLFSSISDPKQF